MISSEYRNIRQNVRTFVRIFQNNRKFVGKSGYLSEFARLSVFVSEYFVLRQNTRFMVQLQKCQKKIEALVQCRD